MAFINCSECNKFISDKANACPSCGCPVSASTVHDESIIYRQRIKAAQDKILQFKDQNKNIQNDEILTYKPKASVPAQNFNVGCTVVILILLIIGMFWLFRSCASSSAGEQGSSQKISAWVAAESAVRDGLKAPSTAKFPWYDESYVTENGDGKYTVTAYVDAENSFGAKIRSYFSCTVSSSGYVSNLSID